MWFFLVLVMSVPGSSLCDLREETQNFRGLHSWDLFWTEFRMRQIIQQSGIFRDLKCNNMDGKVRITESEPQLPMLCWRVYFLKFLLAYWMVEKWWFCDYFSMCTCLYICNKSNWVLQLPSQLNKKTYRKKVL